MLSQKKKQHLQYLYRGGGLPAVAGWFMRAVLTPLYRREAQYVLAWRVPEQGAESSDSIPDEEKKKLDGECILVESPDTLAAVEAEIPSSTTYSLAGFRRYLRYGGIIILGFRPRADGSGRELIGYTLQRRGVLSLFGQEKPISPEILGVSYMEMLSAHRGQKNYSMLLDKRYEYCRKEGIGVLCSATSLDNPSAIKVLHSHGEVEIIGIFTRVSILKGRFVWETPWEKIEAALQDFIREESQS